MSNIDNENTSDQYSTISDEMINFVFNVFSAESMKYYRGILVNLNRNFKKRKTTNPDEWLNCKKVIELCEKYKFSLKCYIKYCFLNKLVLKKRGQAISDIKLILKFPCIADYQRNQTEIEKLYNIYLSITKSTLLIKNYSTHENIKVNSAIRDILKSGRLSTMIATGVISRYFLSLIPNSSSVMYKVLTNTSEDKAFINDLCSNIDKYKEDAMNSLRMFYPAALTKNIIQLCS